MEGSLGKKHSAIHTLVYIVGFFNTQLQQRIVELELFIRIRFIEFSAILLPLMHTVKKETGQTMRNNSAFVAR